jgi:NADH-quinone oxidoreductase subunit B
MGLVDSVELPQPIKFVFNWGRKYSLWVFNFGLACCAIEFIATSMARHDFIRLGVIPFAHGPRQADLLVVSGTLTDKMAPALQRLYQEMPGQRDLVRLLPPTVAAPYWDSYSVTKGVTRSSTGRRPIPGNCPPRPRPCSRDHDAAGADHRLRSRCASAPTGTGRSRSSGG